MRDWGIERYPIEMIQRYTFRERQEKNVPADEPCGSTNLADHSCLSLSFPQLPRKLTGPGEKVSIFPGETCASKGFRDLNEDECETLGTTTLPDGKFYEYGGKANAETESGCVQWKERSGTKAKDGTKPTKVRLYMTSLREARDT